MTQFKQLITSRRRKLFIAGLGVAALLAVAAVVQAQVRALDAQEQATLARLREAARAYQAIPDAQRRPVHDPGKFAAPIGVDDRGRAFPVKK